MRPTLGEAFPILFFFSPPPRLPPLAYHERNLGKVPFSRFAGLLLLNTENVLERRHTHTRTDADKPRHDGSAGKF